MRHLYCTILLNFLRSALQYHHPVQQIGIVRSFYRSIIRNKFIEYGTVRLIFSFQAEHNRSTFQCYHSTVHFHFIVGFDTTNIHRHFQFNYITGLPCTYDSFVAVTFCSTCSRAIYLQCIFLCRIGICIQVRSYRSSFCPSRDTEANSKFTFFSGVTLMVTFPFHGYSVVCSNVTLLSAVCISALPWI